jgi:hypothetical protein
MTPIRFESFEAVLGAPRGWDKATHGVSSPPKSPGERTAAAVGKEEG